MARSTVHYADNETNNILKRLHNKLRPAGTPVQRVEYIIELLLLRIFEVKLKREKDFEPLRKLFSGENEDKLFYYLTTLTGDQALAKLNQTFFPFYSRILSEARKVLKGNPSQKVQDQLVLIEEVFVNSSFTANVKGGMLHEILGLVQELDEERLLHTDLLGDAIESALSETGGTRDIGLYRTPDHIRQLMVAMVDPTFKDIIFDPACGTGGFLFDSFKYVLEKVTRDGAWPGSKTHSEMQDYFNNYFRRFNTKMPNVDEANAFYRSGIAGIEYLGMIRKMAAVNLFIRGLNPANIEQGDSLKMFDPAIDVGSKTVVIANPPFGAERDQTAYPNVWEEYSRESETTILFVKLMFDYLKKGGRCAVIVSEGFLTWDQNSARALRKLLLEEANLKSIISLPQGVFVSKGGQGAKTSILYFEKGGPTEWVWYYKIENDGFSMGVNRKPIPGCQISEVTELFNTYVKKGIVPPETKNSFIIPAQWIKTLDPRIKERIRKETHTTLRERSQAKRANLIAALDERLAKGKFDVKTREQKIWEFDASLENKILNEISKNIDKAHSYSFNFQNYRSSLRQDQIAKWNSICHCEKPEEALNVLDTLYHDLQNADAASALKIICSLDPLNGLEMDIAREYLNKATHDNEVFAKLNDLLKKGFVFPRVKLDKLLVPKYDKIRKDEYSGDFDIVEKISFSDGKIHFREERSTGMDLYKAVKGDLITSKINVHQGAVALAPADFVCSTHYQVYERNVSEILTTFLVEVLRTPQFLNQLSEEKNKGIKNEQGAKFLLDFAIPLPLLDVQHEIVEKIERQKGIVEGVNKILDNWKLEMRFDVSATFVPLGEAVINTKNGWSPQRDGADNTAILTLSCLKAGKIDFSKVEYTSLTRDDIENFYVKEGDFFYSRGNTSELVALTAIAPKPPEKIVFPDLLTKVVFDRSKILPPFAVILFNSDYGRNYFGAVPPGGTPNMIKVSQEYMKKFPVPYLGKIEMQREIIEQHAKEVEALEKIQFLKTQAQQRIQQILSEVWGEEEVL